jgi:DNA ligase-1
MAGRDRSVRAGAAVATTSAVLLAAVAATSATVTATRSRTTKVAALADLLRRLDPAEAPVAVGFLTGEPRQGRIGVGWATAVRIDAPPAAQPSLTLLDVDRRLTELQGTTGPGSTERRATLLADLLARATSPEADLLRRLLTGELRQGALAGLMVDAVARAAGVPLDAVRRAAMYGGDLGEAARIALSDGEPGLRAVSLLVGRPVQPMLAAASASVGDALANVGTASVEWKLDGARVQVHRRGDDVRIFTRNLNDVTARLPGIVAAVRRMPQNDVVLDGEAVGFDDDLRPQRFQHTMSRFGSEGGVGGAGLEAVFFDVLHHRGASLVDEPLSVRLTVLDAVAGPAAVPRVVTGDLDVASAFAEDAVARGHEGVLVKALSSPYAAGRRGANWRKVKPVRTLDLVVLAAEWGHGRRTGWLSNLHLGARDPATGSFLMVGKTFKGLTDELLAWQTVELQARAIGTEGIIVHARPELVVEIALDGVQASTRYPGGVALRFARVRRYRPDKAASEADTIDAVRALLTG